MFSQIHPQPGNILKNHNNSIPNPRKEITKKCRKLEYKLELWNLKRGPGFDPSPDFEKSEKFLTKLRRFIDSDYSSKNMKNASCQITDQELPYLKSEIELFKSSEQCLFEKLEYNKLLLNESEIERVANENRIKALKIEKNQLTSELGKRNLQLDQEIKKRLELQLNLSNAENSLKESIEKLKSQKTLLDIKQNELSVSKDVLRTLQGVSERNKNTIFSLEIKVLNLDKELSKSKTAIDVKENKLKTLTSSMDKTKKEFSSKLVQNNRIVRTLTTENQLLEKNLEDNKLRVKKLNENISQLESKVDKREKRFKHAKHDINDLKSDVSECHETIKDLKNTNCKQKHNYELNIARLERVINASENKLFKLENIEQKYEKLEFEKSEACEKLEYEIYKLEKQLSESKALNMELGEQIARFNFIFDTPEHS